MRGRPTYLDGLHPSRAGASIDPADDAPPDIAGIVADGRYLRRAHSWERSPKAAAAEGIPPVPVAAMRDVRATLQAMARIVDDFEAARALHDCDSTTEAALVMSLRRAGPLPPAARLRAAATETLAALPRLDGARRKGYRVMLARMVLAQWELATGDAEPLVWYRKGRTRVTYRKPEPDGPESMSPVVEFAARVFDQVEPKALPLDRADLVALLKAAQRTP